MDEDGDEDKEKEKDEDRDEDGEEDGDVGNLAVLAVLADWKQFFFSRHEI